MDCFDCGRPSTEDVDYKKRETASVDEHSGCLITTTIISRSWVCECGTHNNRESCTDKELSLKEYETDEFQEWEGPGVSG